jgi:hypothetical protein
MALFQGNRMKPIHLTIAVLALGASATASAQSLKPGLWEITNKMQSSSGQMEQNMSQMQQQMANMPPEQRKMVEEMMAKQGVKMGPGGPGGGITARICMTKEMVERNELPSQRGDCKTTQQARAGNTMKMAFTCTNPPSSGEGQVTYTSPESYAMKMMVNTQVQGKPEKVNMDGTGKWLGSDCGNIKPMVPPGK